MRKMPELDIKSLDYKMTLTVRITSEFRIRAFLCRKLLQLAAWILKANIEIMDSDAA